ncbi:monocarboxylate transporter, putative [Ixodes scapularis]|uniref:Monocarboxylate transporter, putative n=1 Tax=Ixodes scapularis TaxID=6945 RepID=B7P4D2_IXOSC|nr:monocarboxylate transporter, putative [Ixodes scapularis]|eukprot:XP_002405869.1 monocarboxylate transporter, putative [Ixodes scapularis]
MCPAAVPTSAPGKAETTKKNETGVDSCWHIAALGFLTAFLVTVTMSNSTFFYVGFIEEFDVNRESAAWPRSVITVIGQLSGLALATLQRRLSLFTIFLFGGLLSWTGIVASAFVPTMAWMTATLGGIHGLGLGITTMTFSILLAMYFDKYRGLASGLNVLMADYIGVQWISTCFGLSGLISTPLSFGSPSIIGFFRDSRGSYDGLFRLLGGLHLLVSVLFLFVVCVERRFMTVWEPNGNTQEKSARHSKTPNTTSVKN